MRLGIGPSDPLISGLVNRVVIRFVVKCAYKRIENNRL